MNIKEMIKDKIGYSDRTRRYWSKVAKSDTANVIDRICTGFNKADFEKNIIPTFFYKNNPLDKSMTVIDLACGMGRTCSWVAPQIDMYIGVDFIPEMIVKANKHNTSIRNAKFICNDGMTLKAIDSSSVDIVYCELAYQHMKKNVQKSITDEVYRVLDKGGKFFVQVPKFEYYKNKTYSLTVNETVKLFHLFSEIDIGKNEAYYIVEAKK